MSIKRKKVESKVVGAKLAIKNNGLSTQAWIDSGSLISIFTIGELKCTLGKQSVQLQSIDPKVDQFGDYGNNPPKLLGKLVVTLHSNRWTTQAAISVLGGCQPSIIGRDLMPALGLMLVQTPAKQGVLNIQGQPDAAARGRSR